MSLIAHFIAFDVLMWALFGLCAYHATKKHGTYRLIELILTIPYGILLEQMMIFIYNHYKYGTDFLVMIGDAPLAIGVGWSVIIYSAMEFSDRLRMNQWLRPFLDVILALNIDVVMDAVAIRVGYWSWSIPLTDEWFGVRYGNFFGWISVILLFSFWIRVMRTVKKTKSISWTTSLYPLIATGLSLLCLPIVGELIRLSLLILSLIIGARFEMVQMISLIALCGFFSMCVLINIFQQPNRGFSDNHIDLIPASTPIIFHVFFIIFILIFDDIQRNLLLLLSVVMLFNAILVHVSPWLLHRNSIFRKWIKER